MTPIHQNNLGTDVASHNLLLISNILCRLLRKHFISILIFFITYIMCVHVQGADPR